MLQVARSCTASFHSWQLRRELLVHRNRLSLQSYTIIVVLVSVIQKFQRQASAGLALVAVYQASGLPPDGSTATLDAGVVWSALAHKNSPWGTGKGEGKRLHNG